MADEQEYQVSAEPTIYFYVNKSSEQVEYVSMYTIFGITVRPKGKSWTMGTRSDLAKYYSSEYEIWSYDWDNEDDTPDTDVDVDPDNDEDWEIEPVNLWGKGQDLTKADIEEYCVMVNSGEYVTSEEAEKFLGD